MKYIKKLFSNNKETLRYAKLFNTFPHHVRTVRVENNKLVYQYVHGETLDKIISNNNSETELIMKKLGEILGKIHFRKFKFLPNYDILCAQRKYYPDHSKFIPSVGYNSIIHGDLNTKNIIINQKKEKIFIDRLEARGDILFDFSFILSLLYAYKKSEKKEYKKYIQIFFKSYLKYVVLKKNFWISFRNNYMNYGYLRYQSYQKGNRTFPEWKWGKDMAEKLSQFPNFISFIKAI